MRPSGAGPAFAVRDRERKKEESMTGTDYTAILTQILSFLSSGSSLAYTPK
ncbi:hypothetical protein [Nocardia nova]|uniref:hypothetical protein n=1 Tax=Nocardia nova TaxID=37330 RepID=UPI000A59D6C0|nr:hypothetical protein [Nocardia nova]